MEREQMLEQITIRNFQAHEDLILPIEPTLTIIRGPTDAGKSSVIRAIRWLMFNRPGGKKFIKHGKAQCSVSALIDDCKIERKKTRSLNGYFLDREPFKAVGLKVPERIEQFLNVSEINFQYQRDQPLWIALSPTQASKELNRIINLELIDSSLGYIGKETRKRSVLIDGTKTRLAKAKEEKQELAWVLEADRELRHIERMETHIATKRERLSRIERLLRGMENIESNLEHAAQRSLEAVAILSAAVKLRERQKQRDQLSSLLHRMEKLESTLKVKECRLSELQTQLKKVKICPTCQRPLFGS